MSRVPGEGRRRGCERTRARRAVLASVGALMIVLGAVLAARADVLTVPSPVALEVEEVEPALLVSSDWGIAELSDLRPGAPAYWFVDAAVEGVAGARLTLQIRKDGELMEVPNGVVVVVERCSQEWVDGPGGPSCDVGRTVIARATPDDDLSTSSPRYRLDSVDPRDPSYVMVTLSIEDTPENRADTTLMGLTGSLGLGITAVEAVPGETDPPTEPPTDPPTEPPTEPPTDPPTDPPTAAPTGPPSGEPTGVPSGSPGGPGDGVGTPPGGGGGGDLPGPGADGTGLLPTTGAGGALLLWVAGLALVAGGVLTTANAAGRGRRTGAPTEVTEPGDDR